MKAAVSSSLDRKAIVLLNDFGYRMEGLTLICKSCRWLPARIVGRFRSAVDAMEHLIPIIHDCEYTARAMKISGGI